MKKIQLKSIAVACVLLNSLSVQVFAGAEGRGGGDECEKKVKAIVKNTQDWLIYNGHKELQLPSQISREKYAFKIVEQTLRIKQVSCVDVVDLGYSSELENKPCKVEKNESSNTITCNLNKFKQLNLDEKYSAVYASLVELADIQLPSDSIANFGTAARIAGVRDTNNVCGLNPLDTVTKLSVELIETISAEARKEVEYKYLTRTDTVCSTIRNEDEPNKFILVCGDNLTPDQKESLLAKLDLCRTNAILSSESESKIKTIDNLIKSMETLQ